MVFAPLALDVRSTDIPFNARVLADESRKGRGEQDAQAAGHMIGSVYTMIMARHHG